MVPTSAKNTLITLYRGVPLDMGYNQTVYLASNSAQANFFNRYYAQNFNNQSYQRVNSNTLKIATSEDNVIDCNYLSFNYAGSGGTTKTIYAFITNVRYISNNVTAIDYMIDDLQTWLVELISNIEPCFVERNHSTIDTVGSNIVPEPIGSIDYADTWVDAPGSVDASQIYIAATFNKNFEDAGGGYYNGVYSGLCYNAFDSAADANSFILNAVDKNLTDGIVCVFMAPDFIQLIEPGMGSAATYNTSVTRPTACDGYVPKNNKLFTYPYSYILYDNLNGGTTEYKFEKFSSATCNFTYYGGISCKPELVLIPRNYGGEDAPFHEGNYITGYPQCAYATDTFKAWLAQNKYNIGAQVQNTALDANLAMAGLLSGNPIAGIAGLSGLLGSFKSANQIGAQIHDMSTRANTAHGNNTGIVNAALSKCAGGFVLRTPNLNSAAVIDSFFTRYGYAQNRVLVPNLHARPHWSYVKTNGFVAKGDIPAKAAAHINAIFDNGITFWDSGTDIGNYSLDNSL